LERESYALENDGQKERMVNAGLLLIWRNDGHEGWKRMQMHDLDR